MSGPRFSVIIPAHNLEDWIATSIESVQNQTFRDFELLTICDSCTDNTEDVVRSLGVSPITVQLGGAGPVRNLGIEESSGEYLIFLDGDDYLRRRDAFELIDRELRETGAEVLSYDFMWGRQRYCAVLPDGSFAPMVWDRSWRADSFGDLRFNNQTPGQDGDFSTKFFSTPRDHHRLAACLLQHVHPRPGSTMNTFWGRISMLPQFRTYGGELASPTGDFSEHPEGAHLPYRFVYVADARGFSSTLVNELADGFRAHFDRLDPRAQLVITVADAAPPQASDNVVFESVDTTCALQYDAMVVDSAAHEVPLEDQLRHWEQAITTIAEVLRESPLAPVPGELRSVVVDPKAWMPFGTFRRTGLEPVSASDLLDRTRLRLELTQGAPSPASTIPRVTTTITPSPRGTLRWRPLSEHLVWVAAPVAGAAHLVPDAEVTQIDDTLADTAAFCKAYAVDAGASTNCVIVEGRRGDRVVRAAVLVLATDRADINKTVRKHLDLRKVSFMNQDLAHELTGMVSGGITPVGLPDDWLILVDEGVAAAGPVVIGGGLRNSKILVEGAALAALPHAEVLSLTI